MASALWISNTIDTVTGRPRTLAIFGLGFIASSLILAIFAVNQIFRAWASNWSVTIEDETFGLITKLEAAGKSKEIKAKKLKAIERIITAIDESRKFSRPKRFIGWVNFHIAALLVGIFLYVIAQVWSAQYSG